MRFKFNTALVSFGLLRLAAIAHAYDDHDCTLLLVNHMGHENTPATIDLPPGGRNAPWVPIAYDPTTRLQLRGRNAYSDDTVSLDVRQRELKYKLMNGLCAHGDPGSWFSATPPRIDYQVYELPATEAPPSIQGNGNTPSSHDNGDLHEPHGDNDVPKPSDNNNVPTGSDPSHSSALANYQEGCKRLISDYIELNDEQRIIYLNPKVPGTDIDSARWLEVGSDFIARLGLRALNTATVNKYPLNINAEGRRQRLIDGLCKSPVGKTFHDPEDEDGILWKIEAIRHVNNVPLLPNDHLHKRANDNNLPTGPGSSADATYKDKCQDLVTNGLGNPKGYTQKFSSYLPPVGINGEWETIAEDFDTRLRLKAQSERVEPFLTFYNDPGLVRNILQLCDGAPGMIFFASKNLVRYYVEEIPATEIPPDAPDIYKTKCMSLINEGIFGGAPQLALVPLEPNRQWTTVGYDRQTGLQLSGMNTGKAAITLNLPPSQPNHPLRVELQQLCEKPLGAIVLLPAPDGAYLKIVQLPRTENGLQPPNNNELRKRADDNVLLAREPTYQQKCHTLINEHMLPAYDTDPVAIAFPPGEVWITIAEDRGSRLRLEVTAPNKGVVQSLHFKSEEFKDELRHLCDNFQIGQTFTSPTLHINFQVEEIPRDNTPQVFEDFTLNDDYVNPNAFDAENYERDCLKLINEIVYAPSAPKRIEFGDTGGWINVGHDDVTGLWLKVMLRTGTITEVDISKRGPQTRLRALCQKSVGYVSEDKRSRNSQFHHLRWQIVHIPAGYIAPNADEDDIYRTNCLNLINEILYKTVVPHQTIILQAGPGLVSVDWVEIASDPATGLQLRAKNAVGPTREVNDLLLGIKTNLRNLCHTRHRETDPIRRWFNGGFVKTLFEVFETPIPENIPHNDKLRKRADNNDLPTGSDPSGLRVRDIYNDNCRKLINDHLGQRRDPPAPGGTPGMVTIAEDFDTNLRLMAMHVPNIDDLSLYFNQQKFKDVLIKSLCSEVLGYMFMSGRTQITYLVEEIPAADSAAHATYRGNCLKLINDDIKREKEDELVAKAFGKETPPKPIVLPSGGVNAQWIKIAEDFKTRLRIWVQNTNSDVQTTLDIHSPKCHDLLVHGLPDSKGQHDGKGLCDRSLGATLQDPKTRVLYRVQEIPDVDRTEHAIYEKKCLKLIDMQLGHKDRPARSIFLPMGGAKCRWIKLAEDLDMGLRIWMQNRKSAGGHPFDINGLELKDMLINGPPDSNRVPNGKGLCATSPGTILKQPILGYLYRVEIITDDNKDDNGTIDGYTDDDKNNKYYENLHTYPNRHDKKKKDDGIFVRPDRPKRKRAEDIDLPTELDSSGASAHAIYRENCLKLINDHLDIAQADSPDGTQLRGGTQAPWVPIGGIPDTDFTLYVRTTGREDIRLRISEELKGTLKKEMCKQPLPEPLDISSIEYAIFDVPTTEGEPPNGHENDTLRKRSAKNPDSPSLIRIHGSDYSEFAEFYDGDDERSESGDLPNGGHSSDCATLIDRHLEIQEADRPLAIPLPGGSLARWLPIAYASRTELALSAKNTGSEDIRLGVSEQLKNRLIDACDEPFGRIVQVDGIEYVVDYIPEDNYSHTDGDNDNAPNDDDPSRYRQRCLKLINDSLESRGGRAQPILVNELQLVGHSDSSQLTMQARNIGSAPLPRLLTLQLRHRLKELCNTPAETKLEIDSIEYCIVDRSRPNSGQCTHANHPPDGLDRININKRSARHQEPKTPPPVDLSLSNFGAHRYLRNGDNHWENLPFRNGNDFGDNPDLPGGDATFNPREDLRYDMKCLILIDDISDEVKELAVGGRILIGFDSSTDLGMYAENIGSVDIHLHVSQQLKHRLEELCDEDIETTLEIDSVKYHVYEVVEQDESEIAESDTHITAAHTHFRKRADTTGLPDAPIPPGAGESSDSVPLHLDSSESSGSEGGNESLDSDPSFGQICRNLLNRVFRPRSSLTTVFIRGSDLTTWTPVSGASLEGYRLVAKWVGEGARGSITLPPSPEVEGRIRQRLCTGVPGDIVRVDDMLYHIQYNEAYRVNYNAPNDHRNGHLLNGDGNGHLVNGGGGGDHLASSDSSDSGDHLPDDDGGDNLPNGGGNERLTNGHNNNNLRKRSGTGNVPSGQYSGETLVSDEDSSDSEDEVGLLLRSQRHIPVYSNIGSQIPSTTDRDNCQKLIRDKLGKARTWPASRKLKYKLPGLESRSGLQQTWIKLGHDSDTGLYLWGSNPAWEKTKINMRTESFRDSIQQICDTPLERSVTINGIQYQVNHSAAFQGGRQLDNNNSISLGREIVDFSSLGNSPDNSPDNSAGGFSTDNSRQHDYRGDDSSDSRVHRNSPRGNGLSRVSGARSGTANPPPSIPLPPIPPPPIPVIDYKTACLALIDRHLSSPWITLRGTNHREITAGSEPWINIGEDLTTQLRLRAKNTMPKSKTLRKGRLFRKYAESLKNICNHPIDTTINIKGIHYRIDRHDRRRIPNFLDSRRGSTATTLNDHYDSDLSSHPPLLGSQDSTEVGDNNSLAKRSDPPRPSGNNNVPSQYANPISTDNCLLLLQHALENVHNRRTIHFGADNRAPWVVLGSLPSTPYVLKARHRYPGRTTMRLPSTPLERGVQPVCDGPIVGELWQFDRFDFKVIPGTYKETMADNELSPTGPLVPSGGDDNSGPATYKKECLELVRNYVGAPIILQHHKTSGIAKEVDGDVIINLPPGTKGQGLYKLIGEKEYPDRRLQIKARNRGSEIKSLDLSSALYKEHLKDICSLGIMKGFSMDGVQYFIHHNEIRPETDDEDLPDHGPGDSSTADHYAVAHSSEQHNPPRGEGAVTGMRQYRFYLDE